MKRTIVLLSACSNNRQDVPAEPDSPSADVQDPAAETEPEPETEPGDTWRCNELRDGLFRNMFAEDNRNLSSEIAKQEKIINKTLSRVIEKLGG